MATALALVAGLVASLGAGLPAVGAEGAPHEVHLSPTGLIIQPDGEFDHARLAVVGDDGFSRRLAFDSHDRVTFDLTDASGERIADGHYSWELVVVAGDGVGERGRTSTQRLSGEFYVLDGLVALDDRSERGEQLLDDPSELVENHFGTDLGTFLDFCAGCTEGFEPGSAAFGGEAVTIIDISPAITLHSESTADLEYYGWEAGVQPSSASFYIADLGADGMEDQIPFLVEEGAPDNSIRIDSDGEIGLGTLAPDAQLHIADGGDIALEGFGAQWEVSGADDFYVSLTYDGGTGTGFNGRILTIEDDSAGTPSGTGVGIYHSNPLAPLHVNSPGDGSAQVLVTEPSTTVARRQLFRLENNGPPEFVLVDTDRSLTWKFGTRADNFEINRGGSGQTELLLKNGGDLQISGTLSQGSSRTLKHEFETIDAAEVLERVNALPLLEWSYKTAGSTDRHFGPMAEDFHETFGLGDNPERLAPGDAAGIALAAIQGLDREKDLEIAALRAQIEELRALVAELAEGS